MGGNRGVLDFSDVLVGVVKGVVIALAVLFACGKEWGRGTVVGVSGGGGWKDVDED